MKISITGDLVINKAYDLSLISDELIAEFKSSDYSIVNLEAPVTESNIKILKTGGHLKANKESTKEILDSLNINLVTLANNHMFDYSEQGLNDTIKFCQENNIDTVGAGNNLEEASRIYYIKAELGTIAVFNIAENEWASAKQEEAGAKGMDLIDDLENIKKAKQKSDLLFVIVHGGHEYYNLPSPRMQKQYRFYVDQGADLVVSHHTHCISGMEIYKDKPIYYSLGNFLFTKASKHKDWYKGIVLEVEVKEDLSLKTKPVFIQQSEENHELKFIKGEDLIRIQNRFETYSKIISSKTELLAEWKSYVEDKTLRYSYNWLSLGNFKTKVLKGLYMKIGKILLSKKTAALYLNLMRCESHLDLSKDVLKNRIGKS